MVKVSPGEADSHLRINVAGGDAFSIALTPGADEAALARAVAARAGCSADGFFLTLHGDRDGVIVPLTSTLDCREVTLHQRLAPKPAGPGTNQANTAPGTDPHARQQAQDGGRVASPSKASSTLPGQLLEVVEEAKSLFTEDSKESLTALEKFSRLATTMANERTILAWIRTALAMVRTLFAFLSLEGTSAFGRASLTADKGILAALIVGTWATGSMRYYSLRDVLREKEIQTPKCQMPISPMLIVTAVVVMLASGASLGGAWEK